MAPGDKHGPYELISSIGEGGMGEVWKARDTRLDRIVALKFSKAAFSERFEREARAVAALNHPHICTLHDVGPNYLVMEYIEGAPLKGPLAVDKAVEFGGQILDALDAAHKKNITHRDLKPANILITKQGVKLLDFGLARHSHGPLADTDATLTKALTSDGQILGTLQYMSPEQLQARTADARSDTFSFGCVLYEMLSGKRAFSGDTAASVIAAIMEREPAAIDVSPPLDRVIKTCLAKDPENRFQTALDLKRNLLWAVERQPETKQAAPSKTRWVWPAAAALLAVAATWLAMRPAEVPIASHYWLTIEPPEGGRIDAASGFSVSPDSKKVAFVANTKGQSGIWIRSLDQREPRLVNGTAGGRYPFWSPDSRSIAFEQGANVMRVDLEGGAPSLVAREQYFGGHWNGDGKIYVGTVRGIVRVNSNGGPVEQITKVDAARNEMAHNFPHVFANGNFLFRIRSASPEVGGIYLASLSEPNKHTRIVATNSTAFFARGAIMWSRDSTLVAQTFDSATGKLIGTPRQLPPSIAANEFGNLAGHASESVLAFSSAPINESARLVWYDFAGKEIGSSGLSQGGVRPFRLSFDGTRVASTGLFGDRTAIQTASLSGGTWNRLTFSSSISAFPLWSPSGAYLLFQVQPAGLIGKATNGTGTEEQVTKSANQQWPSDWSTDGGTILYYERDPKTERDIWTMPANAEGKPDHSKARAYLRTPFNEFLPRFAPQKNPKWIVYVSDESGSNEVYVQGFPEPRGKWQISNGGGSFPQWNPNGREIYYIGLDWMLKAVSVKIADTSITIGETRDLFRVPISPNPPYAVAPDGKRFLVRVPVQDQTAPLDVIINWPALLGKQGN